MISFVLHFQYMADILVAHKAKPEYRIFDDEKITEKEKANHDKTGVGLEAC